MVGPNRPGVITARQTGIMPVTFTKALQVGIISRSGTLTYAAVAQTTKLGLVNQPVSVLMVNPIPGMNQIDALKLLQDDPQTEARLY